MASATDVPTLRVDKEFRDLCPPLSEEEISNLRTGLESWNEKNPSEQQLPLFSEDEVDTGGF